MAVKYMYIDDQPDKAGGIEAGLSATDDLKVKLFTAENWNQQIQTIQAQRKNYDGLLLDLQLRIPEGTLLYDAPALAQQLRNLSKEGKIEDWPIVLCTTDDLFLKVYDKSTNDDLFDRIYYKDNWAPVVSSSDIQEFMGLANGYARIKAGIGQDLRPLLDARNENTILLLLDKLTEIKTVHGIASFILKQLILKPGLLVDEELLAVRLGIDKNKSEDWEKVKGALTDQQYNGVFSEAWPRWWIGDVMKWWRQLSEGSSLRNLSAEEKTVFLKSNLGLGGLQTLLLPNNHSQSTFWYKCVLSGTPLSSEDGFLVKGQDKKFDWQDKEYIAVSHLWNIDSKNTEEEVLNKVSFTDINNVKSIFQLKRQN